MRAALRKTMPIIDFHLCQAFFSRMKALSKNTGRSVVTGPLSPPIPPFAPIEIPKLTLAGSSSFFAYTMGARTMF